MDVTVQMDTTCWGIDFGLLANRDAIRGTVLWHKYVRHETIAQYDAEGVDWLKSQGLRIYGIVIDGMRGLAQALRPMPVQMASSIRHSLSEDTSRRNRTWMPPVNC